MRRESRIAAVMKKLEDSQFRCALTGWKITPQCFELDHIVSMNDGGTDDPDNLQCVHPLANRAKGTMGNQQFIDMCIAVAIHASQPTISILPPGKLSLGKARI